MKFMPSIQSQTLIDEYRLPLNRAVKQVRYAPEPAEVKQTASITDRLLAGDKTAVRDCADKYGGLIWTLARKYTADAKAAEIQTEEIFVEIWKWARAGQMSNLPEKNIIVQIAAKHLASYRMLHEF